MLLSRINAFLIVNSVSYKSEPYPIPLPWFTSHDFSSCEVASQGLSVKTLPCGMDFNSDEEREDSYPAQMGSIPVRHFGGVRHGFNHSLPMPSQRVLHCVNTSDGHIMSEIKDVGADGSKPAQGENGSSHWYVSNESPSNIDKTLEPDPDCLMTTPSASRHQSVSSPDTNYCRCQRAAGASGKYAESLRAPPRRLVSTSRIPSINMMLNDTPLDQGPVHPTIHALPRSISDCRMSISNASDSTIVASAAIPEQRFFLLNTLYQICLDATTTYIRAFLQSSRTELRRGRLRSYSNRYHPYRGKAWERPYNDDQSKSLMDNIETISTFMWRKARRDEMAPHRAESDAVTDMNNLYKWGENLVGGMEERAGEEEARTEVLHAAMAMCRWLGASDASTLCREIEKELRELRILESERLESERARDEDERNGIL